MKSAAFAQGLELILPAPDTPRVSVPLFSEPCAAGFPSPAADYVEKELDLRILVKMNGRSG